MSTGWIVLPEGLGWMRPQLDALADLYCRQRRERDVIPAFEQTLADGLSETDYERIQSFFDGEHDAVYVPNAGEHARTVLRDALEAVSNPDGDAAPTAADANQAQEEVSRFYDEDPRRSESREIDFGDFWSLGKLVSRWFVSWIEDTSELISVGPSLTVPKHPHEGRATEWKSVAPGLGGWLTVVVDVLCVEPDLTRLESRLAGWEDQRGRPDSYLWLKERVGAG